MTLVYLKLLKHATHHLKRSLSRGTWFCPFARANEADGGRLISQDSLRVNEFPRTSPATERKARRGGAGLERCFFCCMSMSGMRVGHAQMQWWGFLVSFLAGAWMSWSPPWRKSSPERMGDYCRAGIRAPSHRQPSRREPSQRTAKKPKGLGWFGQPRRLGKCKTGQLAAPTFHKSRLPKYSISVS